MVRAISVVDWIARWSWGSVPILVAAVVGTKLLLFAAAKSAVARLAGTLLGLSVPMLIAIYGTGLPKLIRLGLWP